MPASAKLTSLAGDLEHDRGEQGRAKSMKIEAYMPRVGGPQSQISHEDGKVLASTILTSAAESLVEWKRHGCERRLARVLTGGVRCGRSGGSLRKKGGPFFSQSISSDYVGQPREKKEGVESHHDRPIFAGHPHRSSGAAKSTGTTGLALCNA